MLKKEIIGHKMTYNAIIENENHFQSIFDNAPIGIFHSSLEGKLYQANKQLADILGYGSPEELIYRVNKTDLKECVYVNKEDRLNFVEKALKDDLWHSYESKFHRKDGTIIAAEILFKVIKNSDCSVKYLEGFIKDISKRKEAEEHFRKEVERESFLLELYKSAPQLTDKELYKCALDHAVSLTDSSIGFFHFISDDQKTVILDTWNDEALRICNVSFKTHYPLEQAGNWATCIQTKGPVIYNDFKISPNRKGFPEGHTLIKRFMSIPVFDEDKVKFVFGVGNKIEEYNEHDVIQIQSVANELYRIIKQRHWKQELENSETKLRAIFDNATDMIALIEGSEYEKLRYIEVNKETIKRLGYNREELLKMGPQDIDHGFETQKNVEELLKTGHTQFETIHAAKNGRKIDVELSVRFIEYGGKKVALEISRDISERKKAEKLVKHSELYYRTIFENTGTATFIFGDDTIISLANTECKKMFGYSKEEIEGKSWINFVVEEDRKRLMDYYYLRKVDPNSVPKNYEFQLITKQGDIRDVYANFASIPYTNNCLASLLDITKRKNAENAIKASLKDKEILLKEIHHRVKNNLQIISSLLDLQANYVEDKEAINVLQESQNRVKSMAMIHEMLYQSTDLTSIEFSGYVQNLVNDLFYSYGTKSNIKLIMDVEHVFLNIETAIPCGLIISELVSNSLKYAFPSNMAGEISVNIHSHNEEFELTICDDGIGLPADIDFENIQTSLGLRLVNMLVNQLDGSIELDRNHGTKFIIRFKELEYNKRL